MRSRIAVMRTVIAFAFTAAWAVACTDRAPIPRPTPSSAAPSNPSGYLTPTRAPATPTPTVDLKEKEYRATGVALSAQWQATNTARDPLVVGLASARATEAALPTPLILVARGNLQSAGDVVAIGVPRVGSPGVALPEPAHVAEIPFYNSVLSTQHHTNPTAGVAAWVGGHELGTSASSAGTQASDRPQALWSYHPPELPRRLVLVAEDRFLESPRVSPDGREIAYALHGELGSGPTEIRTAAVDGSGDRLIATELEGVVRPGFRLAPLGWTGDGARILLASNSDSEATPLGLHEVVAATGEVRRADTPDETLWYPALDPAGTRVVYAAHQWTKTDPPEPGPPFLLNVLDLATGDAKTLLENDQHRYGPMVWSPEGGRLMVSVLDAVEGFESPLAIHVATGETLPILHWLSGPIDIRATSDLVPVAWLPGEIAVFADGDGALRAADLDAARSADRERATWWSLEPPRGAKNIEFLGYLSPGDDPSDSVLLPEDRAGRSVGPGGWRTRLLTSYTTPYLWRSVLEVVGPKTERWTAMDEYVPDASGGGAMVAFGWAADGSLLFARPMFGGCYFAVGPYQGYRLDLISGAIEPLEGSRYALSPDGQWLAAYADGTNQGRTAATIVFRNVVDGTRVEVNVPQTVSELSETGTAWSNLIWSPDSTRAAMAEVLGNCPEATTATVFVVRAADGATLLRLPAIEPPAAPVAWEGLNQVRLGRYRGVSTQGDLIEVP